MKLNKVLFLISLVAVFFITSCGNSVDKLPVTTPFEKAMQDNYDFIEEYIEENNLKNVKQYEYEKNLLILGEREEEIKLTLIGLENEKLIITNEEIMNINRHKEIILQYISNVNIRIAVVIVLNDELKKQTDEIEIKLTENSSISSIATSPVNEGIAVFDDENSDKNREFIVKSIHLKKGNEDIYKVILN